MPEPHHPRIFLSYARSDLDAALDLRARIEAELGEHTVWHDVRDLGGDHWWTEIEDAIRGGPASSMSCCSPRPMRWHAPSCGANGCWPGARARH